MIHLEFTVEESIYINVYSVIFSPDQDSAVLVCNSDFSEALRMTILALHRLNPRKEEIFVSYKGRFFIREIDGLEKELSAYAKKENVSFRTGTCKMRPGRGLHYRLN